LAITISARIAFEIAEETKLATENGTIMMARQMATTQ
jgi:hypothetical protein